jgi:hypothetical protein
VVIYFRLNQWKLFCSGMPLVSWKTGKTMFKCFRHELKALWSQSKDSRTFLNGMINCQRYEFWKPHIYIYIYIYMWFSKRFVNFRFVDISNNCFKEHYNTFDRPFEWNFDLSKSGQKSGLAVMNEVTNFIGRFLKISTQQERSSQN